jgi:hypothetical protein
MDGVSAPSPKNFLLDFEVTWRLGGENSGELRWLVFSRVRGDREVCD